ncbi:MAG: hypothetical protein HYW65_02105 [Candidatus Liptonbacteria bacterium]|nr:hypothetical protein [Candidatus Liptonbacteria bacterium]
MIVREKLTVPLQDSFVKVVVDIEREILSAACEYHVDCMEELAEDGSKGENLWGANVNFTDKSIVFVSLINIRPALGNRSMEIKLPEIRGKVEQVIRELLF